MSSTHTRRLLASGSSPTARAVILAAVVGTLGVMGSARLARAQDDPPELPEEIKAQLEAMMKAAGEQPEGEDAKGGDDAAKPAVPPPGEKSKDLSNEESIARFQQLLARRPFHGPAFNGLVEDFVKRGKLPELITEYVNKSAALPDDVALRIVLGRLHLRAGDAASAATVLGTIERLPMEMSRQNSELLVLKAEVYQRTGDNAGAERMLQEARGLATSVSETLHLGEALADLYLREGKKDKAVAALEELAAKYPDNYLHQKHVAQALSQRDLHEAAIARYTEMLKLVAAEVDRKCEVLRELGLSQEKLGKRDEAIASYIEAIGLLASDHWLQKELHERVVTLYRAANRLNDLAEYCNTQIKRAPEQTAMRVLLADVQGAMGKPDLGKQTLADAVELFPKDLALSQKRVEFLERVGDAAGVAAEFQRIIGQHPGDTELYISYGQFLASNHQVEGARSQWRHVLGTKVDDSTLALRLGALFEAYELYDDAGEAYERAIAVSPKQAEPYVAMSRMWLLRAEPDKAAAALDRLGAANPNDASVQAALAQALRNLGKVEGALAAIEKACQIVPDQVKYHQTRAELLVQSGELEKALAVRREIVDKISNPVQQAEAIATLVSMYASADKLAALVSQENAALAARPGDVPALLILAKAADSQRDFAAMRKALDTLLAVQPGNAAALAQLAKLQDATGDIDAATATYTKLIQLYPARARQFYEAMVDVKLRYADKAGAVTTLEGMAQADPGNVATMSAVAEQLVRMDEADRALPYFEKALRAQPDRHESRLEYGKALVQVGRLEDSMTEFKVVAQQRTDTDRAGEALAKLHDVATQLGSLEELMDELHKQVELDPHNTLVARVLAQLLVQEFEYERAMELLDLVMRHNPRDVDVALGRAELLRRLARFDEAVEGYQKVLRLPQIDRDYVLGELGKTNFESGQVDQARRLWRQVQNKMYAGSLLKNNGLLEDSVAVLEEGIRLKPDDFALHRNLVAALESAGRTADALAAARRLLDLEPGNVWNIERLAAAHLRSGDRAGAAQVASRLFSAGVGEDRTQQNAGQYGSYASAMYQSAYSSYASMYGYGGGGGGRTNLERGINFFTQNGLMAELETVLTAQVAAQPDNAVLKKTAAAVLGGQLNKPEQALVLMRELETATFPVEHQEWLGKSSQRDHMRVEQYNLIASKPALRDQELARLEAKGADKLDRDDLLEFAIVRKAQGNTDGAMELLARAIAADGGDVLALGVATELLVGAEKWKEAEPHARKLVELLGAQREQMRAGIIERVRREFVRTLPLELQLRVTEDLLADIADKWTMGAGWSWYGNETQTPGYLAAKLTLATICAETDRMAEARQIWQDLTPRRGPDVDRWTMLGDTVQLHEQEDLAYEFYAKGLEAAAKVTGDALLQQVYTSTTSQRSWYGEDNSVDKAFASIVGSFEKRGKLIELYDFLRDTNQEARSKRLAEQYKLGDQLKTLYAARVEEAAKAFRASSESPLKSSVPYFAQVCKLAELYDREGNWDEAQKIYERYCADFPNELGLLQTLGEVAQARQQTAEAIRWEKQVLECKSRLATKSREWTQRDLALTPSRPQPLVAGRGSPWTWAQRWGSSRYSYYGGGGQNQLERWPSWMRLAQLYLAENNHLAAGDAMQRGVGEATGQRQSVVQQASALIQQRQLTAKMLPVLRTLAVYAPSDERVQLAFADSLEASGKKDLAAEVCNRLLRRGVSDLGVLTEIKRRIAALNPDQAGADTTIATLESDVAANPGNLKARLRLAKAYYYALQVDQATELLAALATEAPHLEGIHEMLVEVYTLRDDSEKLVEALKAQIERTTDERQRRQARWRLVDELLAAGKNDEALATVKELGDPRDPRSYVRIGTLLQYFGKHADAIACLEKTKASARRQYGGEGADFGVAQAMVVSGDIPGAAKKIMDAVADQAKQQVQYGGVYGMYDTAGNPFQQIEHVFVLYPELATEVSRILEEKRAAAPADPQLIKLAMALNKSLGRPDKSEAMLEKMIESGASDQSLVAQQIDRVLGRKDYPAAIAMAEKFIEQQPKPKLPPGVPAQYASFAVLQSPRTFMLCKLGDVYWEMGEQEKAFETYKRMIDPKIEETKLAYATICIVRGRTEEAGKIVEEALAAVQVKPPNLLQLRAGIAALDGKPEAAFDALAEAARHEGGEDDPYSGRGASPVQSLASVAQMCGMTDRFAAFLREKIQKNPLDWESYSTLASTYRDAGRPDDAIAVLDEADKQPALAQQALAMRLQWMERTAALDELIALKQKSIELSEKDVDEDIGNPYGGYRGGGQGSEDRDQLGLLLWEKGDHDGARRVWTERSDAQRADTYTRLGQLYLQQHAYEDAEKAFARAVELDPDNASMRISLAEQMYYRGDLVGMLPHMLEAFSLTAGRASTARRSAYGDDEEQQEINPDKMSEWATALAAEPKVAAFLAGPDAKDRADDYRVMLTALTGDWDGLERELAPRVAAGTHDPLAWSLWAKLQQRKCDWPATAKALNYLKRSKLTTIAQHRDRLKLVLAGKQFKEAAAGTRQAQPGAGMQMPPGGMPGAAYSGYGGYSSYGYWDSPQGGDLLPTVYIQLGEVEKAERSYLISGGGDGVENRLPQLASLMWDRQAKDRALELMRLSMMASSDRYSGGSRLVPQYAGMLAESGKVQEAIDLLVRAYRCDSTGEREGMYASMYGSAGMDESVDRGQGEMLGGALYELMKRYGKFEPVLAQLVSEAKASPEDPRLAQLVISMQKRGGRWSELRQSLAGWKAARPNDLAMKMEDFHAACQLRQWDDALKGLEELRKESPDKKERWALHEAFLRFMMDDTDAAASVLMPLLTAEVSRDERAPDQAAGLFVCMDKLGAVIARLEREHQAGELDDESKSLLHRLYVASGERGKAAAMALVELWTSKEPLAPTDPWYRALSSLAATDAASIKPSPERSADAALITLLTRGPREGLKAFEALATQATPSVEALRGCVLAAQLAGDEPAALAANTRLLDWLSPRRFTLWHTNPQPRLDQVAKKAVAQAGQWGMSQVATQGASQQLAQVFSPRRDEPASVLFDDLFTSHSQLQRLLMARAGKAEDLRSLARLQGRTLSDDSGYDPYNQYGGYIAYGGYSPSQPRYSARNYRGSSSPFAESDWQAVVREAFWSAGRPDLLAAEYQLPEVRIAPTEWAMAGFSAAAVGREADASKWRMRRAESLLASLSASDTPDLGSSTRDPWRWYYGYSASSQEASRIKWALMATVTDAYQPADLRTPIRGQPDELWELALLEPTVQQRLLKAGEQVGPGWGTTRTFQQLVQFFRAKEEPRKVIELVERAYEKDRLTSCPQLNLYVWACYKEKAYDKLESVFAAALRAGSTISNDVDTARLVTLRAAGKDAEADALESRLLAACVSDAPNKHRLRPDLVNDASSMYEYELYGYGASPSAAQQRMMQYAMQRRYSSYGYSRGYGITAGDLPTVASVANLLGVRYDPAVGPDDVTVASIRSAYQRMGQHAHAARLLDRELAEVSDPRDQKPLLIAKLRELHLAKKDPEATQTASALEKLLREESKARPQDAAPLMQLARLYASDAYGSDYAKALEALAAASRCDPACDPSASLAVHCLYKLDRHKEALEAWQAGRRIMGTDGMSDPYSAPTIFYAAMAAAGAGDKDLSRSLARQALYMYPAHGLAARTQELIK